MNIFYFITIIYRVCKMFLKVVFIVKIEIKEGGHAVSLSYYANNQSY